MRYLVHIFLALSILTAPGLSLAVTQVSVELAGVENPVDEGCGDCAEDCGSTDCPPACYALSNVGGVVPALTTLVHAPISLKLTLTTGDPVPAGHHGRALRPPITSS